MSDDNMPDTPAETPVESVTPRSIIHIGGVMWASLLTNDEILERLAFCDQQQAPWAELSIERAIGESHFITEIIHVRSKDVLFVGTYTS